MFVAYYVIAINLFVFAGIYAQTHFVSPCPDLFQYEPLNHSEPGRWYGTATLLSDSELTGVWLRLIFDKPSIQLGNWLGEVKTADNKEYLIKNPVQKIAANTPYKVRFYIKYNTREAPPMLHGFRLNSKTVCPSVTSTKAPVFHSEIVTPPSFQGFHPPTWFNGEEEDNDFFKGDLAVLHNSSKPAVIREVDSACGTVVPFPRPLITYGEATHEAEYPWHAALSYITTVEITYICGASLISRYHLITVASCVTRRKSTQPLSPDSLVVYLGKFNLKRWSSPHIQDKEVARITPHPEYDAQTYNHNIAIIKLASPIEITDHVRPVCLWDEDTQLSEVIHRLGTVVGWGWDENGKVTDRLTKAKMPVVSQNDCIYSNPDFYSKFASANTFCAGFRNGTSVCNGDSGGGMVFPKATTSYGRTVWQLRGIVSISMVARHIKCDSTHYVIFTDVAKYLDWIKATLLR